MIFWFSLYFFKINTLKMIPYFFGFFKGVMMNNFHSGNYF